MRVLGANLHRSYSVLQVTELLIEYFFRIIFILINLFFLLYSLAISYLFNLQ